MSVCASRASTTHCEGHGGEAESAGHSQSNLYNYFFTHIFPFTNIFVYFYKVKMAKNMKKGIIWIYNFYVHGFRNMTWGRQLWWLILLKVFILFAVLRMFFFKPALAGKSEQEKIEHVSKELTGKQLFP